jgi:hypothetical protein
MGLIREPFDVDFEVDPRPLTKEEKEQISNYIKTYKAGQLKKQATTKRNKIIVKQKKVV